MKSLHSITEYTMEEEYLLQLLKASLHSQNSDGTFNDANTKMWDAIISMAEKHSVLSLLFDILEDNDKLSPMARQRMGAVAKRTILQQYHLLFFSKYFVDLFERNDIEVAIMKGVTIGAYYPVPELRKSGDVDLLLTQMADIDRAKKVMLENGFEVKEEQLALHHISFVSKEGIDIEIHTLLAEPFDNEKTNIYLQNVVAECRGKLVKKSIMGVELPVLSDAYFAFELLLHMLQHFLRAGFGLKLLCDWVVFWKESFPEQEKCKYLELVNQAGIKKFSDIITLICIQFLGLEEKEVSWMNIAELDVVNDFLKEILRAEEFGKSDINRMVVMRGTGIVDYIREFHHQMRLNFPKLGRCFLLWPILWGITLFRFLRNNRTLRNVSTKDILKEAKRRSTLMKQLNLFQ